jgi:hypothetical protein
MVPAARINGQFLASEAGNQAARPFHCGRVAGEGVCCAGQALNTAFGRGHRLQWVQYSDGIARLSKRTQRIGPGRTAGMQHNRVLEAFGSEFGSDGGDGVIRLGNQNVTGFPQRNDRRKQRAHGFGDSARTYDRYRMVTHFFSDAVHNQIVA